MEKFYLFTKLGIQGDKNLSLNTRMSCISQVFMFSGAGVMAAHFFKLQSVKSTESDIRLVRFFIIIAL